MRGYQDFPQNDLNGAFEEPKFVKTLVTIILWIIAIYGTFSVIRWCAGPRLEDLMRGYGDPLTGKQRRKKQRESDMPSVKIILKSKFLMV